MSPPDPHFRRKDPGAHWRRVAAHLRAHPADLAIARENLDRWERWGRTHAAPLREWRRRLEAARNDPAAWEELLAWLAADNHDAEPLKSCSPFVGLPLEEESPAP